MTLRFKLVSSSIPFTVEKPIIDPTTKEPVKDENGQIVFQELVYEIREMSGRVRDEFLNQNEKRIKKNNQGEAIGLADHIGMFSKLLCRCIYDEAGKLIPEETIQSWPTTTQEVLFEEASKLNNISKKKESEEETAGNV